MTELRDPTLDVLLDLDGQVLVVDPKGGHWVRFVQGLRVPGRRNSARRFLDDGGRSIAREGSRHSMTTLKVGIASYEEMKARTMAVARGERRVAPSEPKVWFTSTESFAKVLSAGNRELLRVIAEKAPGSLERAGSDHGQGQVQSVAHAEDNGGLRLGPP